MDISAQVLPMAALFRGRRKDPKTAQFHLLQKVGGDDRQTPQAVLDAPFEIDGGGFVKIPRGDRDVADPVAVIDGLSQELRIEDEIVRIAAIADVLQDRTPIDAKAGMKIAQVLTQGDVLDPRQEAIAEVLIEGHAACERLLPGPD